MGNLIQFQSETLPPLGAEDFSVTISGSSGGSFTAANFHTVYSDFIKGAGLFQGGPYSDNTISTDKKGENYATQAIANALEN